MQHRMPRQIKLNSTEQAALDIEICEFIKSGIVKPCTPNVPGSFYGNLFTRPKKDGSARVIFNLKKLTPFLVKHHFFLETVKHVILMMRRNCLFSSIDFKHAFFSVQIDPTYRKFLRFVWNNKHYQFICMPQGLGPASRIFTKILKPAFAHLRGLGLEICGYIDDSISIHDDNDDEYEATMNYAVQFFDKLGFTINTAKSVLPPVRTKIIEHLEGFVFNSENMTVELTIAKKDCIHDLASKLLESPKPYCTGPGTTGWKTSCVRTWIFPCTIVLQANWDLQKSAACHSSWKLQCCYWLTRCHQNGNTVVEAACAQCEKTGATNKPWTLSQMQVTLVGVV